MREHLASIGVFVIAVALVCLMALRFIYPQALAGHVTSMESTVLIKAVFAVVLIVLGAVEIRRAFDPGQAMWIKLGHAVRGPFFIIGGGALLYWAAR